MRITTDGRLHTAIRLFRALGRVLLVILVAMVIYDLLLGPLFGLSTSGKIPHAIFRGFYEPMFFLERRIQPLSAFNDWYIFLWDRRPKTEPLENIEAIYRRLQTNENAFSAPTNDMNENGKSSVKQ